ncbi:hypothetical protein BJ170DRAFT_636403 [Xylariales sp. AK1849]|nr:hypothetical protein BJ170DRAFT_636403 [Xylariales sp. AK1849]
MMANPMIVYPLLMLSLVAVAIYVLVSASNLTLPISLATRVLTIFLPIIAAANVYFAPSLHRIAQHAKSPVVILLAPAFLQILQGILTVVLATLSFEGFLPGRNLNCNLQGTWQELWKSHDGRSIERIQDAFNCCGFNSERDMSWPRQGTNTGLCSEMYHRHSSCANPWTSAMQYNSGLEFGVAVIAGVFQLIHLTLFRLRNSGGMPRRNYKRLTQSVGANPEDPLLTNVVVDSAAEHVDNEQATGGQGYGALNNDANPRLEPSGLGDDRSPW